MKEAIGLERIEDKKERIEARIENQWGSFLRAFLHFHDHRYSVSSPGRAYVSGARPDRSALIKSVPKEFFEDGKGLLNFRYFQIGICRSGREPDPYFFLKFTRYRENEALLEEIRKLGGQFNFSLHKIPGDAYRLIPNN